MLWVLGGVGLVLVYGAYKGKNPKEILANVTSKVKPA